MWKQDEGLKWKPEVAYKWVCNVFVGYFVIKLNHTWWDIVSSTGIVVWILWMVSLIHSICSRHSQISTKFTKIGRDKHGFVWK